MTLRTRPLGNRALASFGTTIFAEMSGLAAASGAINLGQGFPDTDGPIDVLDAAVAAIRGGRNQYPPGAGARDVCVCVVCFCVHVRVCVCVCVCVCECE